MSDHAHGGCCGSGGAPVKTAAAVPAEVGQASMTITSTAAAKLKEVMAKDSKDPATHGLRIGVQGGGCSGLSYFMDWDTPLPTDRVFEEGGVKVIVDPRSIQHLNGSVLDFADGLQGSGFAIKNPNVKSSCGCGQSFTT